MTDKSNIQNTDEYVQIFNSLKIENNNIRKM